jgi:hypothetical protein
MPRGTPKIVLAYEIDGVVESISGYGELTIEQRLDRIDAGGFGQRFRFDLPGPPRLTTTIEWIRWGDDVHPHDEEIEPPQREIEQ